MKFNLKGQIRHDDRYPYKCTPQESEWGGGNPINILGSDKSHSLEKT